MQSGSKHKASVDRLWAMQVFARVIETGSFSRAAASLNLANSTVTTCVRNLEEHLGAALIDRNNRSLSLTESGERFFADCRQILQAVDQAEAAVHDTAAQVRGTLRVEAPIAFGQALICPALADFARRHPAMSLEVTLTNQPRSLIESGTDLAIRMGTVEEADLVARPLLQANYVVCCTPTLAASLPSHPGQLDARLCLGLLDEHRHAAVEWQLSRRGEQVSLHPAGPLNFNNSGALIEAALAGVGLVHVLDVFAQKPLAEGTLCEVFTDWTKAPKPCYAVTTKARATSPKVRLLMDFLVETAAARHRPHVGQRVSVATPRTQRV